MTVIIDAITLSAFLLEEGESGKIRELLIQGVCATDLVVTESCNSLLTALRRRRINEKEARNALEVLLSFVDTNIKILPQDSSLLREAYEQARENGSSIYDSVYIVLAKRLNGSLASRDPKQIEFAKKSGVKVIDV
ncbi:MAG TPA: type II toxin-antitoxin system VapC family toxin [Nitrososphaerales archaeon]|nr:type II toxin-antitoxin system VapC family toxin [Nitrososphaerales archaeon]